MSIKQYKDPLSNSVSRGKRLKTLRKMADMSREKMEEKYHISANTIQSWEAAKAGGLTIKGAERIINAFHLEGISCTIEWLLYGVGSSPMLRTAERFMIQETSCGYNIFPEDKAIVQELQMYRALNKSTIDLLINDNGMSPQYLPGDYVAGIRHLSEQEINAYIGQDCIVETANNEILLRRIQRRTANGLYNLACINPDTSVRMPTLYEQRLISAALVSWHRRPDSYAPPIEIKPVSLRVKKRLMPVSSELLEMA